MTSRLFAACSLVLLLSGCIGADPRPNAGMAVAGDPFQRALHAEYTDLALAESQRYDWQHASYFARKAEAAARGQVVTPETPGIWGVPPGERQQIEDARVRLTGVLDDPQSRRFAPGLMARAQASLDCWVEEAAEGRSSDVGLCRDRWRLAMAELELLLRPLAVEPAAAPEIASLASDPIRPERHYEVFFEKGQAAADDLITHLVADVAEEAVGEGHQRIEVTGHTDRTGPRELNEKLSRRRAEVIADLLAQNGVPRDRIRLKAYGEAAPAVPTSDGVEQPLNRRVVIRLL